MQRLIGQVRVYRERLMREIRGMPAGDVAEHRAVFDAIRARNPTVPARPWSPTSGASLLGTAPAAMLFPCARGNGLYGAWKGFRDAQRWGWTAALPAMVACQPVGANSLEVSLRRGAGELVELSPARSLAASTCETVADRHALEAIRTSHGAALSATDEELVQAMADLGREGLCVEPASALVAACLPRWQAIARPPADAPIVCLLTATGTRWPRELARWDPGQAWVDPMPSAVDQYLEARGLADEDHPPPAGVRGRSPA